MSRTVQFLLGLCLIAIATPTRAQVLRSHHVFVVVLENHSYEQVIGNPEMPYFNQLAREYGLANRYFASVHGSLQALMFLTAGKGVAFGRNPAQFFDVDNIVRQLELDGRDWKVYASHLPFAGYLGGNLGPYLRTHNPVAYFSDVEGSLRMNIVPFVPDFQEDVQAGRLADYSYLVPDDMEDAHNGSLPEADRWLSRNIPSLLNSPEFRRDGILFITWDEGRLRPRDTRGRGGRVATLVIGPLVKQRFQSDQRYDHLNMLRTVCDVLGLSSCPGRAQGVAPMSDFLR